MKMYLSMHNHNLINLTNVWFAMIINLMLLIWTVDMEGSVTIVVKMFSIKLASAICAETKLNCFIRSKESMAKWSKWKKQLESNELYYIFIIEYLLILSSIYYLIFWYSL